MFEEKIISENFKAYEDGKHRRYKLLFAVNGGAFAVAKLFLENNNNVDVNNIDVLGSLALYQLSIGLILFTIVMVVDIFIFGQKMRNTFLPGAFGWQGKGVLVTIGILICGGWLLVAWEKIITIPWLITIGLGVFAIVLLLLAVAWHFTRDPKEDKEDETEDPALHMPKITISKDLSLGRHKIETVDIEGTSIDIYALAGLTQTRLEGVVEKRQNPTGIGYGICPDCPKGCKLEVIPISGHRTDGTKWRGSICACVC